MFHSEVLVSLRGSFGFGLMVPVAGGTFSVFSSDKSLSLFWKLSSIAVIEGVCRFVPLDQLLR